MLNRQTDQSELTGFPSIDKPWLKYYTEEEQNAPLPEGTIYQYMIGCNAERMDTPALNYYGRLITWRELDARIDQCARALKVHGVKQGDFVSICMLSTPEAAVLIYAVNKIGAVSNMVVLNATEEEIRHQLELAESRILFTVDIVLDKLTAAASGTAVDEIISVPIAASMPAAMRLLAGLKGGSKRQTDIVPWKRFLASADSQTLPSIVQHAEDLAVLEYTSGTTAESKAVMLSNRAINAVAFHYAHAERILSLQTGEKMLSCVPLFLALGLITNLHVPLCLGLQTILSPDPSPQKMPQNLLKYHPNHFIAGPMHIEALAKDWKIQKTDLSFWESVSYGGDKGASCIIQT